MDNDVTLSRRSFVQAVGAVGLAATSTPSVFAEQLEQITDIAARRELFVENTLISRLSGGARLQLHQPTPREVSFI